MSGAKSSFLTIAWAVLTGRRLLILDEATSNVGHPDGNPHSKAMDKLMRGRTCFVIAHRLSTIVNADRILVINNGDIVEQEPIRSSWPRAASMPAYMPAI